MFENIDVMLILMLGLPFYFFVWSLKQSTMCRDCIMPCSMLSHSTVCVYMCVGQLPAYLLMVSDGNRRLVFVG